MILRLLLAFLFGALMFAFAVEFGSSQDDLFGDQKITFAWDPNTEEDLQGYKIYYGKTSRKSVSGKIEAWCSKWEPDNKTCFEEWKKICTDGASFDQACHKMLFEYDGVVDVGNVTERTLSGFNEGEKYYFAATAYDKDKNESLFSIELYYVFTFQTPDNPAKLRIENTAKLKKMDPIKEIYEDEK